MFADDVLMLYQVIPSSEDFVSVQENIAEWSRPNSLSVVYDGIKENDSFQAINFVTPRLGRQLLRVHMSCDLSWSKHS